MDDDLNSYVCGFRVLIYVCVPLMNTVTTELHILLMSSSLKHLIHLASLQRFSTCYRGIRRRRKEVQYTSSMLFDKD